MTFKLLPRSLLAVACFSTITNAYAGEDYNCTIERIYRANGEAGAVYEAYQRQYLGKVFTVERTSGVMIGALKNSYVTVPQVIDYGSTENSYKVVTTMRKEQGAGAGSSISALNISEYESTTKKPFVFMDGADVFIGKCVHF